MAKRFIDFYRDAVLNKGSGGGGGYPEPTGTKSITQNGTNIDVKDYAKADVAVPNSYSAGDEGKVVDNGALVAQTSKNIESNGTVDTTKNNQVVVSVPNSYSAGDEGKVVKNGTLASQSNATYTQNDTYDTTDIKQVTVNVSGGTPSLQSKMYEDLSGDLVGVDYINATPDQGYDGLSSVEVSLSATVQSLTAIGKWLDTMSGEYMPEWGDYLGAFLTVPLGLFSKFDAGMYGYVGRDDILVYKLPATTDIAEYAFQNVGFDMNDGCPDAPEIPLMFELDVVTHMGSFAFANLKGHSVIDPFDGVPYDLVAIRITQSDEVCAIEMDTFTGQSGTNPKPIMVVVPDSMVASYEAATNWADAIMDSYVTIMGESDPDNPWNNI